MQYSIIVNTCDSFEDCWNPFFRLFKTYWADCQGKIFLNTEYKDYSYPGLDIIAVKGCGQHDYSKTKRATWSQCLLWALDTVDTDVVLYLQEDYFFKDKVQNAIVEEFVSLMEKEKEIKCIQLTDQSGKRTEKSNFPHLNIYDVKQPYRVSCQAALWRKDELKSILCKEESAWDFEEFGSQRSTIIAHLYLAVSRDWVTLNHFEIIPYIFTGIIRGRWKRDVVALFENNGIQVDFSKRGFEEDVPPKPFLKRVQYRLDRIPKLIRHYFILRRLRKTKVVSSLP